MLLARAAGKGHVAVKRGALIDLFANQRESEKGDRDARHQTHAIGRHTRVDEPLFGDSEVALTVGKRTTAFHGAAAVGLALDFQKRELAVQVMPDPDLVSGSSAAPVGVIERAIGGVEINALVARPAL